jgi:hypothetical protein
MANIKLMGSKPMHACLTNRSLLAAAGLTLLLQMANDMTGNAAAAARVSCEIRASRHDGAGKLDAIISAAGPISGTYVFTVRKRTGGEVISQSGDFKAEGSSPTEITKASVDLEPGAGYDASLEVKWPNGSSSCSSSVS